jgi:glycosyltransferase involved in cell wall biosynthesis
VTGLLANPGDAVALAAAMNALLADPARRRAMGEAALKRARALFSAERIVPLYEALYERHVRRRA